MTHLWIDADAAPVVVREIVFRAALRLDLQVTLVANRAVPIPPSARGVAKAVVVREGPDQADRYMLKHAVAGDLAITSDIPLAADLVAAGVVVIDVRGECYTSANIAGKLSLRNFMDGLRNSGVETGGAAPYRPKDKQAFAAALDRHLAVLRRDSAT